MAESDDDQRLLDLIQLAMVPGVGPHIEPGASRAVRVCRGGPGCVARALCGVAGVGPKIAEKIARARHDFDAAAELALCRRMGVELVSRGDPELSPAARKHTRPAQPALCERCHSSRATSSPSRWSARGTARPTASRIAERLSSALARTGFTVVSGLARGIDAAAHRGAIKAGGRTIAVLANGLASVYPPEHEELARAVALAGALVSEMPMGQSPLAGLFTQRNRIISGLSLGVVVVEATPRSGSLSTASHAMEQNREVFAVPGPADSLSSRGCHRLIRDGARLVETVDDILEELGPLVREVRTDPDEPPVRHPAELALTDSGTIALGPPGRSSDRRR